MLRGLLNGVLSKLLSGVLSRVLSGVLSKLLSGVLSGLLSGLRSGALRRSAAGSAALGRAIHRKPLTSGCLVAVLFLLLLGAAALELDTQYKFLSIP